MSFFRTNKETERKGSQLGITECLSQIALEHAHSEKLPFHLLMNLSEHFSASDFMYLKEVDTKLQLVIHSSDFEYEVIAGKDFFTHIARKADSSFSLIATKDLEDIEKTIFKKLNISTLLLINLGNIAKGNSYLLGTFEEEEKAYQAKKELQSSILLNTVKLAFQSAEKSLKISHTKHDVKIAEEANLKKSKFIANMSHELRTPLTAILGYSQVMRDGTYGELNEKQHGAINSVIKSSQHLKQLMDEILNLARVESGKEIATPDEIILSTLIQQAQKLMQQQAITKGVRLIVADLDKKIQNAKIFADPKHAKQILINILSNAIKYTPEGGIVTIDADLFSREVCINISDTGIGISTDRLEKLFARFERGSDPYSSIQEGTGIGLNISNKLVKLNNGRIDVESTKNEGSKFSITLPLVKKGFKSAAIEYSSENKKVNLEGIRALVIDDNIDTCTVLEHILKGSGTIVYTANSVREAEKIFNEKPLDVILTDLAMPGKNGIDFINYARNATASEVIIQNSKIPIMVLSACAFAKDKTNAFDAGANSFLPKPFKPQDVLQTVQKLTKG